MLHIVALQDITIDTTTAQELSSLQPSGAPAIQPFESETKKPQTQLSNFSLSFFFIKQKHNRFYKASYIYEQIKLELKTRFIRESTVALSQVGFNVR